MADWHITIKALANTALPTATLSVSIHCSEGHWTLAAPVCNTGTISFNTGLLADEEQLQADFQLHQPGNRLLLATEHLQIHTIAGDIDQKLVATLTELPINALTNWLAAMSLTDDLDVQLQNGHLSGQLDMVIGNTVLDLNGELMLDSFAFDNTDGTQAGADISMRMLLDISRHTGHWQFDNQLVWQSGEWLLGDVYLPSPPLPVNLNINGQWQPGQQLMIEQLRVDQPDIIQARLAAHWPGPDFKLMDALHEAPYSWNIYEASVNLHSFQQFWLDGWLGSLGLNDLQASGQLILTGESGINRSQSVEQFLHLNVNRVDISDQRGRLELADVNGVLHWSNNQLLSQPSALSWEAATLYKLPLGSSTISLELLNDNAVFSKPSFIPILDGGLHIEQFSATDWQTQNSQIKLTADLQPVSLQQLGTQMGWPAFGGTLSGRFPGLNRTNGIWSLDGRLLVSIFDGEISIDHLQAERPFGVLPSLSADIRIDRIQLEPLTQALDIGRISGPIDGGIHELRLVDWQPAQFDAWIRTSNNPQTRRRVSQRAIDTLSNVGGGLGSGLQTAALRLFKEFRYKKLGISCILRNGICQMDGIEDRDAAFVIIKGSGIPRLSVTGIHRRVNWQQMVNQLKAANQSDGPSIGNP